MVHIISFGALSPGVTRFLSVISGQRWPPVLCAVTLQTDVQKILRNARKLPDKTQTFYKVNAAGNQLTFFTVRFGFVTAFCMCVVLSLSPLETLWSIIVLTTELTVFSLNLSGAEPSQEGRPGFRFLGAPEGSGRPAGARVHPAAGLGPSRCCLPALPCRTTAQTGQHWRLPVCGFWLQHRPHAHWLLQLSYARMNEDGLKHSSLSLYEPRWRWHQCVEVG